MAEFFFEIDGSDMHDFFAVLELEAERLSDAAYGALFRAINSLDDDELIDTHEHVGGVHIVPSSTLFDLVRRHGIDFGMSRSMQWQKLIT